MFSKCLSLPVGTSINTKMYVPREPDNTPFNGSYISSTKMPNLSFKWGWGGILKFTLQ